MKPNFFIIGAARSGTTSLYLYLEQHPDIYFSDVKELNFFSNPKYWSKGLDWYETRFTPTNHAVRRIGEASTSYTRAPFSKDVPKRIAEYAPDAKLIYLVRNPVDRLISHYLHRVQVGQETRDMPEIIDNLENEPFAWQSRYHYQLANYRAHFNDDQILVVSMDELKRAPEELVSQVFRFLEVDDTVVIQKTGKVFNANNVTTRKSRFGLAILSFYRANLQQKTLPYRLKRAVQASAEIGASRIQRPQLDEKQLARLKAFYQEDATKLQDEYGIDTRQWFD